MANFNQEECTRSIEEFCNELKEEGFEFNDIDNLKGALKDKYKNHYNVTRLPPRAVTIISKIASMHVTKQASSSGQSSDSNEEPAPKPARVSPSNGPTRRLQVPKHTIVDDIVNAEKKRDMNLKKNTTVTKSSHVEFCNSRINGMNIRIGDNEYEVDVKTQPADDFPEPYQDLSAAEQSLIELIVGKETSDEYIEQVNQYTAAISELREKYQLDTDKKVQKFTYTKSKNEVKFLNPADNCKVGTLPTDEAEPIIEFNKYLNKTFESEWKKGIAAGSFDALKYLKLDVIRTQNIIKFDKLISCYPKVFSENTSKITNTVLSIDDKGKCVNLTDKNMDGIKGDVFAPDYMMLFSDVKKFNGTQFQRVVKNIYTHRSGIVLHNKCDANFKRDQWLQAYANIEAMNMSRVKTEHEKSVIEAWKNVLSSKFAFYIIMHCVPESSLFNKAMIELIQEGTTIKLMQSVLYPISFAFTPFMLGHSTFAIPAKQLTNMSETTWKKKVAETFMDFGSPAQKAFNYDDCNWIYYAISNANENLMINLLNHLVKTTKIEKEVKKPGRGKKSATQTDDGSDEHNEEEDN